MICLVLVMNLLALKLNFETLEGENYIDAGGTVVLVTASERSTRNVENGVKYNYQKYNSKRDPTVGLQNSFENRLRKLLEIMETNLEKSASNIVTEKSFSYDVYFPDRLLFCDDVMNISNMTYLASGWTKAVYKGYFKGLPVAVKTVDVNGPDVKTCKANGGSETACYVKAAKKIVKEIVLLQALSGEHVLKVYIIF